MAPATARIAAAHAHRSIPAAFAASGNMTATGGMYATMVHSTAATGAEPGWWWRGRPLIAPPRWDRMWSSRRVSTPPRRASTRLIASRSVPPLFGCSSVSIRRNRSGTPGTASRPGRAGVPYQSCLNSSFCCERRRSGRPTTTARVRETFALRAVSVLELAAEAQGRPGRAQEEAAWRAVASVGEAPPCSPSAGETTVPVDERLTVVLCGRRLEAAARRVVEAFAAEAAVALRQERLAEEAAARPLAEADRMRTALLAAVSHDLRTPLASAKAAVSSLRSHDIEFDADDREELLATADESLDRLGRLVANLLDMSRLQAGALGVTPTSIGLEDAVPRALDELGPAADVVTDIPADLPAATADPGLLERVLVNIVANALRHSPPGQPPTITASAHAGQVELRVIDTGPRHP